MDSRELGLVLARQLFGIEDLHYGLWEDDLELSLANAPLAQQRYSDMLMAELPCPSSGGPGGVRVLDVGCGAGNFLRQLLERGYHADGLVPAPALAVAVRERLADWNGYEPTVFECRFEDLPLGELQASYDVVLFSESFQYVPLQDSVPRAAALLRPGGLLLISDFFRSDADGDGGPGDRSFGGGHRIRDFSARIAEAPFEPVTDRDITVETSRNLELVNDLLMNRARPAALSIHRYLGSNHPLATRLGLWLFRKRVEKIRYKYFSGHRSREVFERYKTYRVMTFRRREG